MGLQMGSESVGSLVSRDVAYAASYARAFGSRVSTGITYKLVQLRADCTGRCPDIPSTTLTTSALDFGAQVSASPTLPLSFGLAIRNVRAERRTEDDGSDVLPTRLHGGVRYTLTVPPRLAPGTTFAVEADFIDKLPIREPTARLGAELAFQRTAHLRVGYAVDSPNGASPSIGLGLVRGSLAIDLARVVSGLSADAGQAPTYLSLRYLF
jgi:hypothetical protein